MTVSPVEPLIGPVVARIAVLPVATPVANPPLAIVAAAVLVEVHVTKLVRFWLLPSLKIPIAVNCNVALAVIEESTGVTAIDTKTAVVTVRPVVPVIEPEVALIVVLPGATPVAKPPVVIVATDVLVELQITELVSF